MAFIIMLPSAVIGLLLRVVECVGMCYLIRYNRSIRSKLVLWEYDYMRLKIPRKGFGLAYHRLVECRTSEAGERGE
jgi:hypothetical protein